MLVELQTIAPENTSVEDLEGLEKLTKSLFTFEMKGKSL